MPLQYYYEVIKVDPSDESQGWVIDEGRASPEDLQQITEEIPLICAEHKAHIELYTYILH